MKKFSALLVAVVCLCLSQFDLFSQNENTRNCGTMGHLEMLQHKHPETVRNMEKIEAQTNRILQNSSSSNQKVNGVITIPVVVHVLYNTAQQNISDAQILSQIDVLNEDFRRTNSDASNTPADFLSIAADSEIEFCMATIDPDGNATDGITRKQTSNTSWSTNDNMKFDSQGGIDAWPTGDYLNMWVCNMGGGILGYAQFPGGPANTDGVVCLTTAFGTTGNVNAPFNLGRTTTHEVGHWLNLRHIWGDGNCNADDFVSDTPTAGAANYTGSPCTYPGPNSCNDGGGDLPDMFQNYMDYSDDGCMNLYTTGQKDRMRALFDTGGFRVSLLNSAACGTPNPDHCTNGTLDGDETGIDCGGSCDACPTCDDNIQNGDETGVDCGGSCPTSCPISYCGSQGNDSSYEYISNVSVGTINNNSGSDNGYGDYTSLATDLELSSSNVINLTPAFSGTAYNEYWEVYIDYNGDGDFTDAGEEAYDSGSASSSAVSGTITVPANATVGLTRMRVQMRWNQSAGGPCESFAYGEVEDYSINIINNGGGGPTCDDGILNGDETGVDCGGSCPNACATCDDGILNGDETGVDCGGSCPTACVTCDDGILNGDEEGVDCGGSCPNTCATCDDGILNGDETGVDCGGSCPTACATCDDGILNGDETGVDCGGSCPTACATCDDGILNGDEEGIDCGGSCPNSCGGGCNDTEVTLTIVLDNYPEETSWSLTDATNGGTVASGGTYGNLADGSTVTETFCLVDGCYDFTINDSYGDGICCSYGNGSYSLTDASGSLASGGSFGGSETTNFCLGDNGGDCTTSVIDSNGFENGWGIWNDGGSDCRRSANDAVYATTGTYCVRLRDNTGTSVMTTDDLNLTTYEDLTVSFAYHARSMDNANEDFWLQISTDGGSSYTIVEEWNRGDEFENNDFNTDAVTIAGPFTSNTRLRFRCDASGNSDWIYIDDVIIEGCSTGNNRVFETAEPELAEEVQTIETAELALRLFPNPAKDLLNIDYSNVSQETTVVNVYNLAGKVVLQQTTNTSKGDNQLQLDISSLQKGTYILQLNNGKQNAVKKFIVF